MRLWFGFGASRAHLRTGDLSHSIVAKADGVYGVTATRLRGAHAVALRHERDARLHVFDANFVRFAVKHHSKLKALMDRFRKPSGCDENVLGKTATIVGIRPPIGK